MSLDLTYATTLVRELREEFANEPGQLMWELERDEVEALFMIIDLLSGDE